MLIRTIFFSVIFIAAAAMLFLNLKRIFSYIKVGQPENRTDNLRKRFANMFKVAFAQSKIFREPIAGPVHAGIFWGFLVLLFSASESVFQGFYHGFSWSFLGPVYTVITFSTDVFCVLVFVAIIFSFLRRYVIRVKRLQGDAHEKLDAALVLGAIFVIVSSLTLENAAGMLINEQEWAFRPVSFVVSGALSVESAPIVYEICWWVHILFILAFANYLPFSKHLHVYTSIPNVFFSNDQFVNKLPVIDFEKEGVEKFGVVDIEDFGWKTLFDSYTCTHCGRCTSVCPANLTGKLLDPREIIVQVRRRTFDKAPLLLKMQSEAEQSKLSEAEQKIFDKKFIGEYEAPEALWQCTSCGACMQECPVQIEHVPAIINMRRSLVMMESDFPALLQTTFANLENNSAPWAFPQAERADWADGTGIKSAAENPDFDILFWVGCAGSFDDRAKKVSLAFSKLLQIAGVNFAILGIEEQCNGDVARRAGNEYLADMLVKMNIDTLNRYKVKKIVTFCPHCFNTFKNEYPDFGANYEVYHHSQYLNMLVESGKLKIKPNGAKQLKTAYHDSCYLGRYNNIYDAPRNIIERIPGAEIKEASRCRDKGLCCGAGGAQMFMEETVGKRVNVERTEELLECGADTIAVNCPFCMTMITDGLKAKDKEEEVLVKDIAEILLDNVEYD